MEKNDDRNGSGSARWIWIGCAVGVLVVVLVSGWAVVRLILTDDGAQRKRRAQMVTLLREPPPPPPKVEKPPEPEIKKQEEVIKPEKKEPVESKEDKPSGKNLGVDAEGGAGSDAFGLVGNKGGRALIGGDDLMRQYAGYFHFVQDDIRKRVQRLLEQNGGLPRNKVQTTVKILLDQRGVVVRFRIVTPSGDPRMDQAVKEALEVATISQPPPEGMPRGTMTIRITTPG